MIDSVFDFIMKIVLSPQSDAFDFRFLPTHFHICLQFLILIFLL